MIAVIAAHTRRQITDDDIRQYQEQNRDLAKSSDDDNDAEDDDTESIREILIRVKIRVCPYLEQSYSLRVLLLRNAVEHTDQLTLTYSRKWHLEP